MIQYHVQVGAFRSRAYAEDLIGQLRRHRFAGALVTDGLYRVWVDGPLSCVGARHLAADLQAAGFATLLTAR